MLGRWGVRRRRVGILSGCGLPGRVGRRSRRWGNLPVRGGGGSPRGVRRVGGRVSAVAGGVTPVGDVWVPRLRGGATAAQVSASGSAVTGGAAPGLRMPGASMLPPNTVALFADGSYAVAR